MTRALPLLGILGSSLTACGTLGLATYGDTGATSSYWQEVDPPGTSTGTSSSTTWGLTTTTTGSGGGGGGGGSAPWVQDVGATWDGTTLIVSFTGDDPDGGSDVTTVEVTVDGVTTSLATTSPQVTWVAGGSSTARVAATPPAVGCVGTTYDVEVVLVDASSLASNVGSAQASAGGADHQVAEVGDDPGDNDVIPGNVSPPETWCGDIHRTGNDGSTWTADIDFVEFTAGSTGDWTFTLTWSGGADYDLILFDDANREVDRAAASSNSPPERLTTRLSAGKSYKLLIGGWSGAATAYTVTLQ